MPETEDTGKVSSSRMSGLASVVDSGDPRKLYEIIEKVGRGSYGSVFKARCLADSLLVAIKTLALEEGEVRWQFARACCSCPVNAFFAQGKRSRKGMPPRWPGARNIGLLF